MCPPDAFPPRIKTARRLPHHPHPGRKRIITAADPLPDDNRQAIEATNYGH
jgi:hypothetical protein